jgi:hypothetical protein
MRFNLNSGWGPVIVDGLRYGITGKTYVVGKAAVAYIDMYKELFINDNDGTVRAFSTLAGAVAACTANSGDTILVLPGHTETISSSSALTLNVAGINIWGLGKGSNRPTFTLDTATTAVVNVTAANVTVQNILFVANFAAIATCFTLTTAKDFTVNQCEFRDTSSILNFVAIVTTNSTDNAADGLTFTNNIVRGSGTTAATTPIKIAGNCDRVTISGNFITLAILNNTSAVLAHTSKVVTGLLMQGNKVFRPNTDTATGGILITTSSTTNTGIVCDNYVFHSDVAAAILVTAGSIYGMFNNLAIGDADASGYVLPAIGTN